MGQVLQDRERLGHLDLEASEMAIRTAMHQMGGVLLEKLLNSDGGGYRGAHLDCSQGHAAEFVGYRDKEILTVVSSVEATCLLSLRSEERRVGKECRSRREQ